MTLQYKLCMQRKFERTLKIKGLVRKVVSFVLIMQCFFGQLPTPPLGSRGHETNGTFCD